MKLKKKNAIIIFVIYLLILVYILKDDYKSIIQNLLLANKTLIFAAVLLVILYWMVKALSLFIVVKKNGGEIKYQKILELVIINQFFCGITPFAVGGEPMQIYLLNKRGIEVFTATNMIIQEFIMYQTALILVGIFSIFANFYFKLFEFTPLITKMIIVGFTINILVAGFLILISFSKKFSRMIVKLLINLGHRFKLIKDKEKKIKEWEVKLKDYNRSADTLMSNKKLFLTCVSINIVDILMLYTVPLVVFTSLNFNVGLLEAITFSTLIAIIGNFVPIPGGSGGVEFGFLTFFGLIAPDVILKSALIVWRFITYYFGMIVGGIFFTLYEGDEKK